MDYNALKSEIMDDPLNLGYKNQDSTWKDSVTILSLFNTTFPVVGSVSSTGILKWCAQNDSIRKLQAHANDAGVIGSIASAALILIQSAQPLNLADPDIAAMFSALVSASVFTSDQATALTTAATTQNSRAQILGFENLQQGDIEHAKTI